MAINYDVLIKNMVTPLVLHPEDVLVKTLANDGDELAIQVLVHQDDLGRVIGKGGRIASAIRTIVYAGASKEGKHVRIDIDAF
ncbi:MAG TPA: KH domain-containing protein [Acholeplasma sp.]|nr:KH domain-containing protein [Acholeplasma sp.]